MLIKDDIGLEDLNNQFTGVEDNEDAGTDIDFVLLLSIAKKSIIWVILLLIIGGGVSYFYLRYTKPVYKSSSVIKLEVQSEAGLLGIGNNFSDQNLLKLSGEIEIIKSNLIFEKLKESLVLHVNYYEKGNVQDNEIYKNSPFSVLYEVKNNSLYDKPFYVTIKNKSTFNLTYQKNDKLISEDYQFGKVISNDDVILQLTLHTPFYKALSSREFYFVLVSDRALKGYLNNNLEVNIINAGASTLGISFTDNTPSKAKDIVNKLDSVYRDQKLEQINLATEQTITFLNKLLDETRDSLYKAEVNMESFVLQNKTYDVKSNFGEFLGNVKQLESEKEKLAIELNFLNRVINLIQSNNEFDQLLVSMNEVSDPQLVSQISVLNELNSKYNNILKTSKRNTKAVESVEADINFIKRNINELVVRNKESIQKQLNDINQTILDQEVQLVKVPSKGTQFDRLNRFYSLYEKYYLSLMDKKVQYGISIAGTTPDMQILSHASLPSQPISPNSFMIYAIGLGAGLFLGIALIAGRYFLHNTVTSQRELERSLNVPVLGVIPTYNKEKLPTSKLVVDKNPKSAISESIRSIRTNMEFLANSKKKRIISITSTISGEGKTFVSVNVGGIMAMTGQKVVILDMDMRKPKIHLAFDAQNARGMSSALIDKNNIFECIQKSNIDTLDFISAGPIPPNPSELILSSRLDTILDELKKIYDVIIIDTPPVGVVTDGVLIMRKSDIPLYVVRANYSKKVFIKNINKLVKVNNFTKLAVILNDARSAGMYGYDYGYTYGYGYYDEPEPTGFISKLKNGKDS